MSRHTCLMHRFRARAFTLVELLLCLAIIVILMALLLPTLKVARERARIVVCATQLKQWGYVHHSYAMDYKEFLGGVPTWELRDCFSGTNGLGLASAAPGWPPDNVPPWGGSTNYEQSPWNRSTYELGFRGLGNRIDSGKTITRCPSRAASGYKQDTVANTWGSGLDKPNSLTYVDYWSLCGFSNDPASTMSSTDWGQPIARGWYFDSARQPVVHLRSKYSTRAILVMDREWDLNSQITYGVGGNNLGNLPNHRSFGRWNQALYPVGLASGANVLLADFSVLWSPLSSTTASENFAYARDFYRIFYVGKNLQFP